MRNLENRPEELPEPYITTAEVMRRLAWSKRTLKAKIRAGILREGMHFFQREGCHPRWKWSAVVMWLEGGERKPARAAESTHFKLSVPGRKAG